VIKRSIVKGILIRTIYYTKQTLTLDAEKVEAMLGSYSADPEPRSTEVISDDFPSGMVARGTYTVTSKVVDLDNQVWLGASILPTAQFIISG
jgi:Rho GDP-dissociation inhibitor